MAKAQSITRDLALEFVQCRTLGHAWDEFNPDGRRPTVFKYALHLRCTRCTTERHDGLTALGDVAQREYKYPDGYALAEKVGRSQFRLEMVRRRNGKR